MIRATGKVFLVGAGPGDPNLLTLKALRAIQSAGVVLYDRLVSPGILALAPSDAALLYAGKEEGEQEATQAWIERTMVSQAWQGVTVVRLKGGDPFIFGRGGEEQAYLESHGVEVEVIPGVSSALAAPAAAGIPLTLRGISRSVTILTGHCGPSDSLDYRKVSGADTLVVLMGVSRRAEIAAGLIASGRDPEEPAAFIENATTSAQRVLRATLGQIASGSIAVRAPAVLVVGKVAALARDEDLGACVSGEREDAGRTEEVSLAR